MGRRSLSRRRLLALCSGTAFSGLAGCGGGSDTASESPERDTSTASETPTVVFTDTATPTSTPPSTPQEFVFDGGDLAAFVDALEAADRAGGGRVAVEPGTYRFAPLQGENQPDSYHAGIGGVSGVTVEGNGATFLFTDPLSGGIHFAGGKDLTLRNLTVDYDPVPFTQGVLREVSDDRERMTIELDDGFPSLDHEMFDRAADVWASVHGPDGSFVDGLRASGTPRKMFASIEEVGERRFELTLDRGVSNAGVRTGNRLTVVARNHNTAVTFGAVDRPRVENVTVHTSGGTALSFPKCESPVVENCYVGPPEGSTRQTGTDGDGVRIVNATGEPRVENCRMESLLDDNVVVQQVLGPIDAVPSVRTVELVDPLVFDAAPGDRLDAMTPDGRLKRDLPPVAAVEEAAPEGEPVLRIEFESAVSGALAPNDLLRNASNAPDEFSIRNNELRNNRGIQVRIAASNGTVEGNTLVGASRNAVELETDTDGVFVPKGVVTGVTVRENTIRESGLNFFAGDHPAGIRVHHLPRPGIRTSGHPNRDIVIENNDIARCAAGGIDVEAAANVDVRENTLRDLNHLDYSPGDYGMAFSKVDGATVTGNTVESPSERLEGFGWQKQSEGIDLSDNELLIDGDETAIEFTDWIPVELAFDEAQSPGGANRELSFRCYELRLTDGDGGTAQHVDIGGAEADVIVGAGGYSASSDGSRSWRWFGTPAARVLLFFERSTIERTAELGIYGQPIDDGMSLTASLDGEKTGSTDLGTRTERWYTVSLS